MENKQSPLRQIAQPLLDWYIDRARILPWRSNPQPYWVWVSEIMLQQTRVETARPYFDRFIAALPTIQALAEAPEEQLLKLWEGLGYYSRARNLQKAARLVVERHGGALPASAQALRELPGVGDYTAGAVASIAFGLDEPAVDGNVLRVVARLTACQDDITQAKVKQRVTQALRQALPAGRAGDFNQSLMELGATVCLPNGAPLCSQCPVSHLCRAREQGLIAQIPVKAPKKARRIEVRTVFFLVSGGLMGLRKRPESGLLAGLWELPNAEGALGREQAGRLLEEWGLDCELLEPLKGGKHIFTHVEWRMAGYYAVVERRFDHMTWASPWQREAELMLPTAFRPVLEQGLERMKGKKEEGQLALY